MKKTIIITGSGGRLGTALSKHFTEIPEYKVVRISRGRREGFYTWEEFFSQGFLDQVDTIVHLGWSSVPKTSEDNFGMEWQRDLPLLIDICHALRSRNQRPAHFIFFSTAGAIYGDHGGKSLAEDAPCIPANMYGWAKLHAEQLLRQFSLRFPLDLTILRISNAYGIASRRNDQQGVIPYIIQAALEDRVMRIWGDGTALKDYIHSADIIEAVVKIIRARATGLYNVCYGKSYSLHDIIRQVEQITGKKIRLRYTPAFPWDNAHVVLKNEKIRKALSWQPQVSLQEGIDRLIRTYVI